MTSTRRQLTRFRARELQKKERDRCGTIHFCSLSISTNSIRLSLFSKLAKDKIFRARFPSKRTIGVIITDSVTERGGGVLRAELFRVQKPYCSKNLYPSVYIRITDLTKSTSLRKKRHATFRRRPGHDISLGQRLWSIVGRVLRLKFGKIGAPTTGLVSAKRRIHKDGPRIRFAVGNGIEQGIESGIKDLIRGLFIVATTLLGLGLYWALQHFLEDNRSNY